MLTVVILNVIILSVIMLNVIMLNVAVLGRLLALLANNWQGWKDLQVTNTQAYHEQ
jgi:hypothetical protein